MSEYRMCRMGQLRLRSGISQAELARAAGVSRQLIGKIELGECRSKGHEKMLRRAFASVIASRRAQLDALEYDLAQNDSLFSPSKEEDQDGF